MVEEPWCAAMCDLHLALRSGLERSREERVHFFRCSAKAVKVEATVMLNV